MGEPLGLVWVVLLKGLAVVVGLLGAGSVVREGLGSVGHLLISDLRYRTTWIYFLLTLCQWKSSRSQRFSEDTDHRVELLLQVVVPGLLCRHDAVTEGLLAPPQDFVRNQVEAFEGAPQEELLHSTLDQDREKTERRAVCSSGTL